MTHQQEQEAYNRDWNKGFQDFVDGRDAFGAANKSEAWNEGYAAAREIMDEEVDAAERECIGDYDRMHGGRA